MSHKKAVGPADNVCPRTGRPLRAESPPKRFRIPAWLAFLTGGGALVWFLVRVIPKPSRAAYPCQRAAFPIAAAFVMYLVGLSGAAVALRRARRYLGEARYVVASLCLVAMLACLVLTGDANPSIAGAAYVPPDSPNTPIGVARGIHPGRVSWTWDPDATTGEASWADTTAPFYWDDAHTNQTVVDEMVSKNVRWLTGQATDAAAWDALFRYFNEAHGKGDVGYTSSETVFIKTNHVDQRQHPDIDNRADIVPQIEMAMLKQLVNQAGVPQANITIGDPSRFIADKSYDRCHALFPDVVYGEGPFYNPQYNPGTAGRVLLTSTTLPVVFYSNLNEYYDPAIAIPDGHIPQVCVDVDYIVNLGVMKGHATAGVTLTGKNWYGCFGEPPGGGGGAQHELLPDKVREYDNYRLMVDMMGHKDLGEKTMLYVLDGLWGFRRHGSSGAKPCKWLYAPFNDDYPSSILMSQDTVAIDSVGLDFLRYATDSTDGYKVFATYWETSGEPWPVDDYLHEAAQANSAPSGTVYDPEDDGTPCTSLGVHEHWNNENAKQYSRNLDPVSGTGIELVNRDLEPDAAKHWLVFD